MALQDWLGHWRLDAERSVVAFTSPTFWGLAKVKGRFTEVEGSGEATAPDLITGRLEIASASVDTGNRRRDDHLRSADFFDAATHPAILVTVTSAALTATDTVRLHLQLTVKDVNAMLDLPAEVTTLDDGAVRLSVSTPLNRRDFGVDGNLLGMMADTTLVEATAVFVVSP